jgi:hypothetical protein
MKFRGKAAVAAVIAGALAAPAAAQQSGPVAVYWMSVSTTTGMAGMMGAMAGGGGKRPGLGAMMGAMMGGRGGRGGPPRYSHSLTLQLGSTQRPSGDPSAEHLVPAGLGAGPSLPLATSRVAPPEPREDYTPPQMNGQRPQGKIKIYWGCGEHAAGPPIVIDFAKIAPGMAMRNIPMITANPGRPPSAGRFATYGDWPNEQSRANIPPQGSLVGAHTVQGDYSPPINFSLGPDHDFMAPLEITSQNPSAGGGTRITWNPVPGATGYFAWMMGGGAGGHGDDVQAVMWSSSGTAAFMGAVMDYLPPSEVRRLIASRVVLPPSTTECVIPSEVVQSGAVGMLSMIAYGDEVNLSDPPKPASPKAAWNLKWTVKARYKSTTSTILGMPGMGD